MACLEAEWGTIIHDQVDHANTLGDLVQILTNGVMNNYPLVMVRMWALHREMQDGSDWFQHFNKKLELVDYAQLKELMEDRYQAAFFLAISSTKDDKVRKYIVEKTTEAEDALLRRS